MNLDALADQRHDQADGQGRRTVAVAIWEGVGTGCSGDRFGGGLEEAIVLCYPLALKIRWLLRFVGYYDSFAVD